ncbi:LOW QUALITY PROTEIN: hypothetical protein TorRG33x02_052660 [Trema orientale]|uniref:Retrovirus-related Pol polyprotein from transposon TNT 1-94-like beta-barrel domain-containing protein n=1 Tax=Trema orientale TaxID=63057 RepID=A0A2P5FMM4_TREOI|nr:LOW QUALITY PROTEIN: hypothetical protein TorRG33x02_052660 [Trema orientale]
MVGCESSVEVWHTLDQYFTAQIRAKISQYKDQLRNTKKGSLPLNEYLLKIKNAIDLLASVGYFLSTSDHIEANFSGLPDEYDNFVISVSSRKDQYSVVEIESLLMSQEARIEKHIKELDSNPSVANLATQSPTLPILRNGVSSGHYSTPHGNSNSYARGGFPNRGFSGSNTFSHNPYGSSLQRQSFQHSRSGFHGGRGGRAPWSHGNHSNKPQCQLCGKAGHVVLNCFYRFDKSFQRFHQGQMHAMLTTLAASTPATAWDTNYPDSGATNHVTPDSNNLMTSEEYTGQDRIFVGNGTGLNIKHIGHSSFSSKFSSKVLSLNHLLHVPDITKNLLSVSKFARDNAVYFEFYPTSCFVKDQMTHKTLLTGTLQNGLYTFDQSQLPFLSAPVSVNPTSADTSMSVLSCIKCSSANSSLFDI